MTIHRDPPLHRHQPTEDEDVDMDVDDDEEEGEEGEGEARSSPEGGQEEGSQSAGRETPPSAQPVDDGWATEGDKLSVPQDGGPVDEFDTFFDLTDAASTA